MAWTVLAAIGANVVVAGLAGAFASLVISSLDPRSWPFPPTFGAVRFAGVAAGAALAWRLGRWRGLAGYAGALAAMELIKYAAGAPGRALFCERAGDPCPLPGGVDQLLTYWPLAAGLLVAPVLSRAFTIGRGRANPSLEAAGGVVVVTAVLQLALLPLALLPFAPSADATGLLLAWSVLTLSSAIAGGHVLVRRGAAPWPAAIVLAGILFVVPWLPSIVRYMEFRMTQVSAEVQWLMISPIASALAFVLGAVVTAALARSPRLDADASRRGAR